MQEMAGCDNNRTPVAFQVPDIFVFVGAILKIKRSKKFTINNIDLKSRLFAIWQNDQLSDRTGHT